MGMLDIKIAENEKDFSNLCVLEHLANQCHIKDSNRYFGIARLENLPVGYWNGIFSKELFYSAYIFVAENYREKGFGYELKKHQLEFAKSLGCNFAASVVDIHNSRSLAIQEKCGGEIEEMSNTIGCFTFDLENLYF